MTGAADPGGLTIRCKPVAAVVVAAVGLGVGYLAYAASSGPRPIAGHVTARCSAGGFTFRGHAYYKSVGDRLQIYRYLYRIKGGDGPDPGPFGALYERGAFSNVNVVVDSDGKAVMRDESPDDRHSYRLYRRRVVTSTDRSATTRVTFEAIFDVTTGGEAHHAGDPRCTATTPALPQ